MRNYFDCVPSACNWADEPSRVKGTSGRARRAPDMDELAGIIHLLLAGLSCRAYFDYVPSASNWADEPSRVGLRSPWCRQHGFALRRRQLPDLLWQVPWFALLRVAEYL